MKKTAGAIWAKRIIVAAFLLSMFSIDTLAVGANEIRAAETEGFIQFTGVLERPEPNPLPPSGPSPQPGGKLPQTNEKQSIALPFAGWLLVFLVGFVYSKKHKSRLTNQQPSIVKVKPNGRRIKKRI